MREIRTYGSEGGGTELNRFSRPLSLSDIIAANRSADAKQLTKLVRGELDWIVMKAVEKDRNRRYETASSLATDIGHHLNDEPVEARPDSSLYRFRKTVWRNKIAFAAGGAVIAALMLGLGATTFMFFQERIARQRAVAAEQAAKIEAKKSQQVAQFLKDMLAAAGPAIARGRDATLLREILDKTAERIGKDLKDQPGVEAELRGIMGWVYDDLGDHIQAEAMFRQALAINKANSGGENLFTADLYLGLAWMLHNQGKQAEAEAAFRKSVAIRRRLFGDNDLRTAGALGNLAFNLTAQGKSSEAEPMFRQALVTLRKQDDQGSLASSLNGLGGALHDQGKFAAAEATYREALAMRRKVFGSDHRLVAGTLSNLARLLQDQGRLTEAEVMFREAVATRRRLLGNVHPDLYGAIYGLAQVLQGQGKLTEAETAYREALTAQQKVVESAPNNPLALSRLAWILSTCPVARLRDPGRAVALASQAVEIAPQEAESWNTLGVARYRAGEWQAAVDALDKSIGLPKRGDASNWFFLSMAHGQLGHKGEARSLYEKAVERMDKNQPKNEELLRFRAEAAELLDITEPPHTKPSTQP